MIAVFPADATKGSQPTASTWSRTYAQIVGGNNFAVTSDGGFIIAAHKGFSVGGRGLDVQVVKLNSGGDFEWEREYHPEGYSYATSVIKILQTKDRSYLLVGEVFFLGPGYRPVFNPWLLKLDSLGDVLWSNVYSTGWVSSVKETFDGGYIAVGNFGTIGFHDSNGWVVKLNREGKIVWQETFEGQDISAVDQTRDHGFVVAGTVCVCEPTISSAAAWVVRLDPNGKVMWEKAYLVSDRSDAYSIQETRNGGYIVVGHSSQGALILRLDRTGTIVWQELLTGSQFTAQSVQQTSDGGSIVVGGFLLRLDASGNKVWMKTYGPNGVVEYAQEIRHGEIIAAGFLQASCCGRLAWVFKSDSTGIIGGCNIGDFSNAPLIDPHATVTITTIASSTTYAIARAVSVDVDSSSLSVQTQCFETSTVENGMRNLKPEHNLKNVLD